MALTGTSSEHLVPGPDPVLTGIPYWCWTSRWLFTVALQMAWGDTRFAKNFKKYPK